MIKISFCSVVQWKENGQCSVTNCQTWNSNNVTLSWTVALWSSSPAMRSIKYISWYLRHILFLLYTLVKQDIHAPQNTWLWLSLAPLFSKLCMLLFCCKNPKLCPHLSTTFYIASSLSKLYVALPFAPHTSAVASSFTQATILCSWPFRASERTWNAIYLLECKASCEGFTLCSFGVLEIKIQIS